MAAEAGLAGVSVEDIDLPGQDAYPFDLAVERVRAAIAAARDVDIVLTARADGWMTRAYDADEAVRRCRAFAEAGAEVIYAPLVKEDQSANWRASAGGERAGRRADDRSHGRRNRRLRRRPDLDRRNAGAPDAQSCSGRRAGGPVR